jgi:hypothetical protein
MAVGYAPDWLSMLGSQMNYTDYSGYDPTGVSSQGYGNSTSGYDPATQALVDARNNSGVSTRDVYSGGTVTHDERATPRRDNSAGATNFQSAFADDPYYQRSDVAPMISATNRDVEGNGNFGIRGWMNEHPLGVMGAFAALAAGGAALSGLGGAGGASGAAAQHALPASYGAGGAGGLQTSSGLGIFANGGAGGMANVGVGNAGVLANSGAIAGGAGGAGLGGLGGTLANGATRYAGTINDLLGAASGGGGGNVELPYMGLGSNYGKPTQQQQPQRMLGSQMPNILPSMNQPLQNFGRKPLQFSGQTVWV